MKYCHFLGYSLSIVGIMLCGCEHSIPAYYRSSYNGTGYRSNAYSSASYSNGHSTYNRTTVQPQPRHVLQQPPRVIETTPVFSNPTATGSEFQDEYRRLQAEKKRIESAKRKLEKENRERQIDAFLSENSLWGGSMKQIREQFKTAIQRTDKKIMELRKTIELSGGSPTSDYRVTSLQANRDSLKRKLDDIDNRIMEAIINHMTREAAKRLIWRDEDKGAANAAIENLQHAGEEYRNEANEMLRRSSW